MKSLITHLTRSLALTLLFINCSYADESNIPEPFRGENPTSKYAINYDDLDALLKATVIDLGRSQRVKAKSSIAKTGTRLKQTNTKRLTNLEGNRFYYEAFKNNAQNQQLLARIRSSLEQLPTDAPLSEFNKDEQLAFWLNLYNVTMLDELVKIYPETNIEDEVFDDRDAILKKKLLTVAGVKLSLNDIQYKILGPKYDYDPVILYGLYQGYIGSPNIRNRAYTGKNVYRELKKNANEFVNSNRGTYADSDDVFRISSFYARNEDFFRDYDNEISPHLLKYLEGRERYALESARRIKANISDWTITDVYGSYREFGGGINNNSAAMIDSVANINLGKGDGSGGEMANLNIITESMQKLGQTYGRLSFDQVEHLKQLESARISARVESGQVTIQDLSSGDDKPKEKKDDN